MSHSSSMEHRTDLRLGQSPYLVIVYKSLIRKYFVREINLSPEMIHKTSKQGDDECCVSVDFHL